MAQIDHPAHADDRDAMAAMRAYLATQPDMELGPEGRAAYDAFIGSVPAADGIIFEKATVGGIEGWWCVPPAARSEVAAVHFHGGAYVVGSASAYRNFASHLASATGAATFVPDYALAPEHPFPAAFEDAQAVLLGLRAIGIGTVAVTGDPAGGGLALAVVQTLSKGEQAKTPRITGAVALSPWTDLTLTAKSLIDRASADPILSRAQLAAAVDLYAGNLPDLRDARLSPRYSNATNLPPIMVHVGRDEILLDDALSYTDVAEVHVWEEMTHVFPASPQTLRAAREAIALTGAFLRNGLENDQ